MRWPGLSFKNWRRKRLFDRGKGDALARKLQRLILLGQAEVRSAAGLRISMLCPYGYVLGGADNLGTNKVCTFIQHGINSEPTMSVKEVKGAGGTPALRKARMSQGNTEARRKGRAWAATAKAAASRRTPYKSSEREL